MNPLEQPNDSNANTSFGSTPPAPSNPVTSGENESNPEPEAATLQAIDSIESENTATVDGPAAETAFTPNATPVNTSAPVETAASVDTPLTSVPIVNNQATANPSVSPVEASAAGVAAAAGAQAATNSQTPGYAPAPVVTEKKKANKLVVILLVVALVVVGAVAGYLVWQSM